MIIKRIKNFFKLSVTLSRILGCGRYKILYLFLRMRFGLIYWNKIRNKIKIAREKVDEVEKFGGWIDINTACVIYVCIRMIKPKIVIETGVGPGMSSSIILRGIFDNRNEGKLYSIDLPAYDAEYYPKINKDYNVHFAKDDGPGWLVDEKYKSHWELIIGNSKEKLPELLEKIDIVDIFMHDSLHTDEHINFELNLVFSKMNSNSLYLCDDVNEYWSIEFIRFSKRELLNYMVFRERLGIGKKSGI
ncbi:MAG: class I SAM-dependent methyltransferase [Ignavibacteria bacterium]